MKRLECWVRRNLTAQTDGSGNTTNYLYDPRNRRIKKTLPGTITETTGFDGAGGVVSHTDANGNAFAHTLDTRGRR
jgi:YD repeat-containing protein